MVRKKLRCITRIELKIIFVSAYIPDHYLGKEVRVAALDGVIVNTPRVRYNAFGYRSSKESTKRKQQQEPHKIKQNKPLLA